MKRWMIYLVVVAISATIFLGFSLTKSSLYTVSGEIDPDETGDIQNAQVSYGVQFSAQPKLNIQNFGEGNAVYTINSQTETGFRISINSSTGGAKLTWVAEGPPVGSSDPRVMIQRWNLGQKLSAVAFLLSLMGPLAESLGIFGSGGGILKTNRAAEIGK